MKSAMKKNTGKKSTAKKTVTVAKKSISKKALLSENMRFYLNNGQVISSLKELPQVLSRIDDATFYYHVNEARNDFSNWVNDVFGQEKLAKKIAVLKTKKEMVSTLKKQLS